MKKRIYQLLLLELLLLPLLVTASTASQPDTVWSKIILPDNSNEIIKTMLSPDDSLIFVGFKYPGFIVVYNALTGDSIRTIFPSRTPAIIHDFDLTQDGKHLALCETFLRIEPDTNNITNINIVESKTGNLIRTLLESNTNLRDFARFGFIKFTPDNRYIFTSLYGRGWKDYKGMWHDSIPWFVVIDTMNWQVQRGFQLPDANYKEFAISPNNEYYAVSLQDEKYNGWIEFRNVLNDSIVKILKDTAGNAPYFDMSFSPDSNYFMANDISDWYIWDVNQNRYYRKYLIDISTIGLIYGFTKYNGFLYYAYKDEINKLIYTNFYNFIDDTLVYKFQGWINEITTLHHSDRFYTHDAYKLVMYDSTWILTTVEKESDLKPQIRIKPNPASDYIEISLGAQRAVPYDVAIYDVLGVEQTNPPTSPQPLSRGRGEQSSG